MFSCVSVYRTAGEHCGTIGNDEANEDFSLELPKEGLFVLVDGATPLTPNIVASGTDAQWFAREICVSVVEMFGIYQAATEGDFLQTVKQAVENVAFKYNALLEKKGLLWRFEDFPERFPRGSIVIARKKPISSVLQVFVLGDASFVYCGEAGAEVIHQCQDSHADFEALRDAVEIAGRYNTAITKVRQIPEFTAEQLLERSEVLKNRQPKTLLLSPASVARGDYLEYHMREGDSFMLLSDGAAGILQPQTGLPIVAPQELGQDCESRRFERLGAYRKALLKDETGSLKPRLKVVDDMTCVFVKWTTTQLRASRN